MSTTPDPRTASPEPDDDMALRAVLACAKRRTDERALLRATEDLSVCSVAAWRRQLLALAETCGFLAGEGWTHHHPRRRRVGRERLGSPAAG